MSLIIDDEQFKRFMNTIFTPPTFFELDVNKKELKINNKLERRFELCITYNSIQLRQKKSESCTVETVQADLTDTRSRQAQQDQLPAHNQQL